MWTALATTQDRRQWAAPFALLDFRCGNAWAVEQFKRTPERTSGEAADSTR